MEKCRPFGVTVPPSRWCGVRACELRNSPCGLLSERATSFSYFDAVCTGGMIEPNSRLHCSSLSASAAAPVAVPAATMSCAHDFLPNGGACAPLFSHNYMLRPGALVVQTGI